MPTTSTFEHTGAAGIHRKSYVISSIRRLLQPRMAGQT